MKTLKILQRTAPVLNGAFFKMAKSRELKFFPDVVNTHFKDTSVSSKSRRSLDPRLELSSASKADRCDPSLGCSSKTTTLE
jgi:hypothetical protein